jgi:hypothetical protein
MPGSSSTSLTNFARNIEKQLGKVRTTSINIGRGLLSRSGNLRFRPGKLISGKRIIEFKAAECQTKHKVDDACSKRLMLSH